VPSELTERPLEHADQDLLGVATHAKKLATLIARAALPLTVGIYGPWGAGKTSFANIVVDELAKLPGWSDPDVIRFSAWPYVTPEAIWRALVERIARRAYGQEHGADAHPPESARLDWKGQMRGALLSDALTLHPSPGDPPRDTYQKLVQRLSASAGVANRSQSGQFGGLTVGAFAKLVLAAAGTFSGPIGQLSALFPGGSASAGSPQETAVLTSIEQIRADLQAIFAHAGQKRTIIVIDDLDRCLPEVALDVLETIKIFFFESDTAESQWLFLVPADVRLVGNGLRARLGLEQDDGGGINPRAYLEKIIQLGISLPEIKANDAHSLVADHCPEWAGASDLIISAFDGNPRRIKQQGALLSYKYPDRPGGHGLVKSDTGTDADVHTGALKERDAVLLTGRGVAILAGLVRMNCTDPELMPALRDPDLGSDSALGNFLAANPDLHAKFAATPDLSADSPHSLWALACVADLCPGPDGVPRTWDPTFPYIARTITDQAGTTTPRSLAVGYLRRLVELKEKVPKLTEQAAALYADSGCQYGQLITALDTWIDARLRGETPPPEPGIASLANALESSLPPSDDIRKTLTEEPRLSAIPGSYVQIVMADSTAIPAATEVAGLPVQAFLEIAFKLADAHREDVVLSVPHVLRLAVARDVMERRRYAKVQLLLTRWPELMSFARGQGGARRLRDLETAILRGDRDVELPEAWKHLQSDEHLREFLQLSPSLAQVYEGEVSLIADSPGLPSTAAGPPSAVAESVNDAYQNLYLHAKAYAADPDLADLAVEEPAVAVSGTAALAVTSMRPPVTGEIVLAFSDQGEEGTSAAVSVPVDEITRQVEQMTYAQFGVETSNARVGRPSLSAREILTDIGTLLWSSTIGQNAALETMFMRAFENGERVRLAVTSAHDPLASLPWEYLFIPRHRIFAGQAMKLSVVRAIPDPARLGVPRPGRPLRILVATASPEELGILGVDQEIKLIERSLELAMGDGSARIKVIRDATVISTMDEIRAFRPHVFHFVGHAGFSNEQGVLIFTGEDGRPDLVPAAEIGLLLQERGILLAVLNGCETGWPNITDMTSGVSQTLIRQGVPATIGTTRAVTDDSALTFASEFYKALADGFPAESALVEARKALALKGRDWSAYIMYANAKFPLHTIGIQRATAAL
jgi:hypothetical protein